VFLSELKTVLPLLSDLNASQNYDIMHNLNRCQLVVYETSIGNTPTDYRTKTALIFGRWILNSATFLLSDFPA
jgi:hypothetical protein